jgi:molybdopterin converting factor subunit 1
MTKVRIEYFAILREHAGQQAEEIDTDAGTAGELFDELKRRYRFPETGRLKVAINDEFADWNAALADGDSVVFIPPVAGG